MTASDRKPTVLAIDDDPNLRALCTAALESEFTVLTAENGQLGIRMVYDQRPDVVLLDVTMPAMNGFEVCRRIRDMVDIPIIMLTSHGADEEVARGLDSGADDYVVKPFRPVQLAARIRAALRRRREARETRGRDSDEPEQLSFQGGDLVLDTGRRIAVARGQEVGLSAIEYKLLETFARNAGRVLTHDQILNNVWGYEYAGETGYVKTYVNLLRNKIEQDPRRPRLILSRRGLGYLLEPRAPARSGSEATASGS